MTTLLRVRPQTFLIGLVLVALAGLAVAGARRSQAQAGPPPLVATGDAYGEARVSASSLNLRTGPHVSYTAVAYLMEGEEVRLVGRNRDATWVQIALYNGYRGWVNASYLRPGVDIAALPIADVALWGITAFVTNDPIPVYTGAGVGYSLVGWARPGDVLALNGRNDAATWVHVYLPDGRAGWAAANSPFLPSASINDLPIITPFLDAPPPYLVPYFLVYTGPGFIYEPVDSVSEGQTLSILGRTDDNRWVLIRLPNGREGWIATEIIHINAAMENVPVVAGIAPPQVVGWQSSGQTAPGVSPIESPESVGSPEPVGSPPPLPTATTGGKLPPAPIATNTPDPSPTSSGKATSTAEATRTPVPTATPDATATPTIDVEATTTLEPTASPTSTGTADASPTPDLSGETPPPGLAIVYVYATPDENTAPILRVVPGQSVVLIGRTEEADWIKIWLPGGQEGWVLAEALQLDMDVSVLPVVTP